MTIQNIGQAQGSGVTTITVGVAGVPAGVTILVAVCSRDSGGDANPTMSDTANSPYVRDIYSDGATELVLFRFSNNAALVQNDTIVFAGGGSGGSQWRAITAWYDDELDLASPIDQNPATTSGTSTTPVSNNYTTTVADERVYGLAGVSGPGTDGFTQDGDFNSNVTSIGTTGAAGGTNKTIRVGDRTLTGTETNNYAPTLGTSRVWQAGVIAYKKASGGVTGTGALAAGAASLDGAGASGSTGSGALVAGAASLDGAGTSGSTGTGALAAGAAALDGSAGVTGSGELAAGAASLDGTGTSGSTGAGALQAQAAQLDGDDIVPATRFYLPSTGAAAVSPAFDAAWDVTGEADRRRCGTAKQGTTMATETRGETSPTIINVLTRQYVSDPIQAQTVAGTIKGQIRAQRIGGVPYAELAARVVSGDGLAVRGVLLPVGSGVGSAEKIDTVMKNREFPLGWEDPGMAIAEVAAEAGDRIVLEIGWRAEDTSPSLRQCLFRFGDEAASDLPDKVGAFTDDLNPWIELSATIAFEAAGGGGGQAARSGSIYRSRRV